MRLFVGDDWLGSHDIEVMDEAGRVLARGGCLRACRGRPAARLTGRTSARTLGRGGGDRIETDRGPWWPRSSRPGTRFPGDPLQASQYRSGTAFRRPKHAATRTCWPTCPHRLPPAAPAPDSPQARPSRWWPVPMTLIWNAPGTSSGCGTSCGVLPPAVEAFEDLDATDPSSCWAGAGPGPAASYPCSVAAALSAPAAVHRRRPTRSWRRCAASSWASRRSHRRLHRRGAVADRVSPP